MSTGYWQFPPQMTTEQAEQFARGELRRDASGMLVRADGAGQKARGGLIEREVFDPLTKTLHHREFDLAPGQSKRSTWMAAFMSPGWRQVKIVGRTAFGVGSIVADPRATSGSAS